LTDFLDNLFVEEVKLPLVIGHEEFDSDKDWKVVYLKPKDVSDELTVRNYIEGLRKIYGELNKFPILNNFRALLSYGGIESFHYSNQDTLILGVSAGIKDSTSFNLHLYIHRGDTYGSQAEIDRNHLDKIMEPFIGPIMKYERTLI
jgi:hypothetical protein